MRLLQVQPIIRKMNHNNAMPLNRDEKIFSQWLRWVPNFAEMPIERWNHQGLNLSPDIVCTTESGRRIGVELTEWIDNKFFSAGKSWEKLFARVGTFTNWTIIIKLKTRNRDKKDDATLRSEFFKLVAEKLVDTTGRFVCVLESELRQKAPILSKYAIELYGVQEPGVTGIRASLSLSTLNTAPYWAAKRALEETVERKLKKSNYSAYKSTLDLDALHLLVHYEFSSSKGSPFGYADMISVATEVCSTWTQSFPFDKCWLFSTNCFIQGSGIPRTMSEEVALTGTYAPPGDRPFFYHQIWPLS